MFPPVHSIKCKYIHPVCCFQQYRSEKKTATRLFLNRKEEGSSTGCLTPLPRTCVQVFCRILMHDFRNRYIHCCILGRRQNQSTRARVTAPAPPEKNVRLFGRSFSSNIYQATQETRSHVHRHVLHISVHVSQKTPPDKDTPR